jgi:hypothetical protein
MIGLLAETRGNILPFSRTDMEGRREYGLLKNSISMLRELVPSI